MDIFARRQSITICLVAVYLILESMLPSEVCAQNTVIPEITYQSEIMIPENSWNRAGLWKRLKNLVTHSQPVPLVQPMGIDARHRLLAITDTETGIVHLLDFTDEKYKRLINPDAVPPRIPTDVAIGENFILVTHSNTPEIDEYNFDGKLVRTISPGVSAKRITSICQTQTGFMVSDTPNHTIHFLDHLGNYTGSLGSRGEARGLFNYPTFVSVDASGMYYITDSMNFRVQLISRTGDVETIIGEQGVEPGRFNRPKGVAADDRGFVYVVDASFDNVQVFSSAGGFLTFFGGNGSESGEFNMPTDIAIDGDLLYISDTLNRRVQVFKIQYE